MKYIKQTLLSATLVVASCPVVSSVTLYRDEVNVVNFSAQVQASVLSNKSNKFDLDEERQITSNETWINFALQHKVNEAIAAYATFEWQVNALAAGDIEASEEQELFENRLGYLGLQGDNFGSLSFGKQWSATYTMLSVTDKLYLAKPDASGIYQGTDGGVSGNGRIDQSVLYQNGLGLSQL